MKIVTSTMITFPGGSVSGLSKILLCKPLADSPNKMVVITEETPFHPLDSNWPDQPGDRGGITVNNVRYPIVDSLTTAFNIQTEELLIDQELKSRKIRRNDSSWLFLVGHVIEIDPAAQECDWSGLEASLEVDVDYRDKVSKAHTACHLAALALNKVTRSFWKKLPDNLDSLRNPNLDAEAVISSKINQECGIDRYRCGKSLRKKGFDDTAFFNESEFSQVEMNINKQLQEWCAHAHGIKIAVMPSKAYLHEKREWHCELPGGEKAVIPCGGTHNAFISSPAKVVVTLSQEEDREFTMVSKFIEN